MILIDHHPPQKVNESYKNIDMIIYLLKPMHWSVGECE